MPDPRHPEPEGARVSSKRVIPALAGIDTILLETQPDCPEDMRASTLHPPTLDMLAELGVLDELEQQGLRAPVYHYRNRQSGDIIAFDLNELAGSRAISRMCCST